MLIETPRIINVNEYHMACLLLLDTSGSMKGEPISELNKAINNFKKEVCKDSHTKNILDVAIVEFNDAPNVIQEFAPVEYMKHVNLVADGLTRMEDAVWKALDMIKEQQELYKRSGTESYKPWIIMISDGNGGNVDEVAKEVARMEEHGKLKFFSLGVEGYDSKILHQLSGEKVMKLKGYNLIDFFDWLSKSMCAISHSSILEKPRSIPLPDNVDKDVSAWM